MSLPYETATAGDRALVEVQRILAKFGCASFGTAIDAEHGMTMVTFKWRGRIVRLEASWKGYAQAWLKEHPYQWNMKRTKQDHERIALERGQVAVCSVLRDWVKGQVTAIECGVISFEAAFGMHLLLPDGRKAAELVSEQLQLEDKGNVFDLPQRSST